MLVKRTSVDSIRRALTAGFSVSDIAEPLVSFETSCPSVDVRQFLDEEDFDCAGVRERGLVVGIVRRDSLIDGVCGEHVEPIDRADLLASSAALADVVKRLVERPRLFVSMLGSVAGIVTRDDLVKPAIRMWLFGMISIVEMRFVRLIENRFPDEGWRELLSEGRVQKARDLQNERQRRHRTVKLIDCLQLSDKGTIVTKDQDLRDSLRIQSKRRGEQLVKRLEGLRNNLAHSQDIVESDWETIVLLSENLDRVIEGPPEHPGLLEG
jgi:hypothetical protein